MMEAALNPFYWGWLVALGVPIIIHLINRLRYRRVRWAAMEFLLKSEQKNRRKLILEQLLLLLARCLLVLLAVLLVVRPTWFLGDGGRAAELPSHHVFLLDDSLSMRDLVEPRTPDGPTAFRQAVQFLGEMAQHHADVGTHYWTILKWSDVSAPEIGKPFQTSAEAPLGTRMIADEVRPLRERLESLRPTYLPVTAQAAVQEAARHLGLVREGHKYLHIVSDFRRRDWLEASAAETHQTLTELARNQKVRVRLHDMALPERQPSLAETPPAHGNLGIVQIAAKPRRRVDGSATALADLPMRIVTPRLPFDLHVSVKNFGEFERRGIRAVARIDGVERAERVIDRLGGGEERLVVLNLEFSAEEAPGIKSIAAQILDPELRDHLPVDDIRFTAVELRREVPVLIVDPDHRNAEILSDAFFLQAAFTGSPRLGVRPTVITPRELAGRADLPRFAVVYVCNIAGVGRGEADLDAAGLAALEKYARQGGSVCFFLGPRTNVVSFNEQVHRKGQGIFPVPLMVRPDPEGRAVEPYIDEPPDERDIYQKARLTRPEHPALPLTGELGELATRYLLVNRYFRVDPSWKANDQAEVLLRLTNRRPLTAYRPDVVSLANDLQRDAGRFADRMALHVTRLTAVVADAETQRAIKGPAIEALAALLGDPALAEFWRDKAHEEMRMRAVKLLETLRDGDPLVIESSLGASGTGRVLVFLSPAAPTVIRAKDYTWNNWAVGEMGQIFFVPVMIGVQGYLASLSQAAGESAANQLVGQMAELRLDKDRYIPQVEVWFQPEGKQPVKIDTLTATRAAGSVAANPAGGEPGENYFLVARVSATRGPGQYRLKLNQPQAGDAIPSAGTGQELMSGAKAPEERPLSFNVDNRLEGDLTRIAENDLRDQWALALHQGPAKLAQAEAQAFVQSRTWFVRNPFEGDGQELVRNASWSDFSWLLFAFLGLLAAEMYMAMRFSHHLHS